MTDEEIIFDFLTVEASQEIIKDQLSEAEPEPPAMSVLPETRTDGSRTKESYFSADRAEYIKWYEQEIGPWELPSPQKTP